ncbi:MAG: hypothetical protein ACI4QY_03975 [Oscillospiraceae bacterium]
MKSMRKQITVALALAAALCLVGCTDEPEDSTPVNETTDSGYSSENPNLNSDESSEPSSNTSLEPVKMNVSDISPKADGGYEYSTDITYGNAYGIVYTYSSNDGYNFSDISVLVLPLEMTIDEVLATDMFANAEKEQLQEVNIDGGSCWQFKPEVAQTALDSIADKGFAGYWSESKIVVLNAAGVSTEDASTQVANALVALGIGDVG